MPAFWRTSALDPDSGAMNPPISDVMSPPKNVSSSHAPKPIRADVAARRTSTDSSIPKASQNAT